MPTYDLKCDDCGHRFEVFRMRLLRDDERVCPQCGSENVSRGVGGGVVLGRSAGTTTDSCGGSGRFG